MTITMLLCYVEVESSHEERRQSLDMRFSGSFHRPSFIMESDSALDLRSWVQIRIPSILGWLSVEESHYGVWLSSDTVSNHWDLASKSSTRTLAQYLAKRIPILIEDRYFNFSINLWLLWKNGYGDEAPSLTSGIGPLISSCFGLYFYIPLFSFNGD